MQAVLLAAGRGTRMGPLCGNRPKPLLPVAGRPWASWAVDGLLAAGARDIIVVIHGHEEAWRGWQRGHTPKGVKVRFVQQAEPTGTGNALAAVAGKVDTDFLLLYGDVLLDAADVRRLARSPHASMAAYRVEDASAYGALDVRGSRLRRIAEKSPKPPSKLINAGAYKLDAAFLARAASLRKSARGEFELTDAINAAVADGERVDVARVGSWHEAGRPWHLLGVQAALMQKIKSLPEGRIEKDVHVHGTLRLGKGSTIKSGTYIEGPVVIGRDCRIGPNAYLRGATSIGDGCHVGASVEIKNSILGDRTNVPHLSYVGDSILGSDVNLGAGTSTANLKVTPKTVRATWADGSRIDTGLRKFGAVVGDGTKIGINCSLAPGTIIGRDCLIGMHQAISGWFEDGTRRL